MRRTSATAVVLTILALLGWAVPAQAVPGDPQITSIAPADGAVVPADPNGITVSFTCPDYTSAAYDDGDVSPGGLRDYRLRFSDVATLGDDGRLVQPTSFSDSETVDDAGGGSCTSQLRTHEIKGGPEVRGGTVYWQAYRFCFTCASKFEVGPVRSIVITPRLTLTLAAPARAYAGYLQAFVVSIPEDVSGVPLTVQRKVGAAWRTVVSGTGSRGKTELYAALPRGRQTLRVQATLGGGAVVSPAVATVVLPVGRWSTSAADDGAYAALRPPRNSTLRFSVTGKGRLLTNLRASLPVVCSGPVVGGGTSVQTAFAVIRSARIAPDGTVVAVVRVGTGDQTVLKGRLARHRFTGTVGTAIKACSGTRSISAALT